MTLLILGLALYAVVHLVPSLTPGLKASWQRKLGERGYLGTFSLLLLLSSTIGTTGACSTAF